MTVGDVLSHVFASLCEEDSIFHSHDVEAGDGDARQHGAPVQLASHK